MPQVSLSNFNLTITPFKEMHVFFNSVRNTEAVQNIIGGSQAIYGAIALYNVIHGCFPKKKTKKAHPIKMTRIQRLINVVEFLGNISLIGTGITSRPLLVFWRWSVRQLCTASQLEAFFGPTSRCSAGKIFYLINLSSFILGLPAIAKFIYDSQIWLIKKLQHKLDKKDKKHTKITDQVDFFVTMNTVVKGTLVSRKFIMP